MIIPGLCSVTFRQLRAEDILPVAAEAGLKAIEWGGDVHVPLGNVARAREIGHWSCEAGMQVISFGSYYRAGFSQEPFPKVVETAGALGASIIRIWAGAMGSREISSHQRTAITEDIRRCATTARAAGLALSLERHGGTLTDTPASSEQLLHALADCDVKLYWQPALDLTHEQAMQELRMFLPRLSSLHVFNWAPGTSERLPLSEGMTQWTDYLRIAEESGGQYPALLEFVKGDAVEQLQQDVKALKAMIAQVARQAPSVA